ncbi:MAG TPA: tetratricopeptide repeat protein [Verrucomicrobiae bacterium]|nr:tetratricopeptide repeat protein [Verrucomicrobiae bacterium]
MNAGSQSNPSDAAPTAPEPQLTASERNQPYRLAVVSLGLAALVFAAFQPAFDNGFVGYDDPDYVTSNPTVQQGLNWAGIKWAFTSTEAANWHPLTWLSHMLDVQMFGLNPAGHHLTSVLLHTLSSVLLFLTLRLMTGATWPSLIVAALFGLHPLRAESVVWVAERKDALSTVFWFLTLLAYAGYAQAPAAGTRKVKTCYALTLLSFVCGLMAKPMLVTLPFALLLLDFWPLKRFQQSKLTSLLLEKVPLFLLSLASCVVTFLVQRTAGAVNEYMSPGYRLSNAVIALTRYLGKMFWPTDLAFFYPHPNKWPALLVAGAVVLVAVLSVLAVRLRQRDPALLVGWCWFVGTLIPVIGLVQVGQQSIADRYTYIPSVGILIAVIWGMGALASRVPQSSTALGVVAGVAALGCLILTRQQARVWQSTESLCRHAIAVVPGNYLAHDMLGAALEKRGAITEAMRQHLLALEIKPDYADAYNNLAVALQRQGQPAKAVEHYQRALQLRPRYPEAHFNLAVALENAGQFDNAVTEYSRAVAQRPNYADAHYNLGLLYGRLGQLDKAVVSFQTALRINPNLAEAHNSLGVVYDRMGQLNQAIQHYQQAIMVKPDYPRAHFNLGVALTRIGQLNVAAHAFETALRLKPDYAEARTNLAAVRAAMNPMATPKP